MLISIFFLAFGYPEDPQLDRIFMITALLFESLFLSEIITTFLTSYKDKETLEDVFNLKSIAVNYIVNGPFITHFLAFVPIATVLRKTGFDDDPWFNLSRDFYVLKLLRVARIGSNLIPRPEILTARITTMLGYDSR